MQCCCAVLPLTKHMGLENIETYNKHYQKFFARVPLIHIKNAHKMQVKYATIELIKN